MIGGYTDPKGSRTGFGSLLLGVHDATASSRYAGNVGTGFDERPLRDAAQRSSTALRERHAPVRRRSRAA